MSRIFTKSSWNSHIKSKADLSPRDDSTLFMVKASSIAACIIFFGCGRLLDSAPGSCMLYGCCSAGLVFLLAALSSYLQPGICPACARGRTVYPSSSYMPSFGLVCTHSRHGFLCLDASKTNTESHRSPNHTPYPLGLECVGRGQIGLR